jgi:hypothetical protein
MLALVDGKASDRKLRLFACAYCRCIWAEYPYGGVADALAIAEQVADDKATLADLDNAHRIVNWAKDEMSEILNCLGAGLEIALQSRPMSVADAVRTAEQVLAWKANLPDKNVAAERRIQCDCLRCLFRPLAFHPIHPNVDWFTPTVSYFAEVIYDEQNFDELPALADALADAGCADAEILNHCRQPGQACAGMLGRG